MYSGRQLSHPCTTPAHTQLYGHDTGKKTFQDYPKIMDMFNKLKQSSNNGILATLMFLDFELPIENKAHVLVDKKFDGKQINPEIAQAAIYANFTIHIENKSNPAKKPQ